MAELRERLKRLRALNGAEWRALTAATFLLPLVALSLKLRGYEQTRTLLTKLLSRTTSAEESESAKAMASHIARMVDVAARYGVYRTDCLTKALVIWWLLARLGIHTEIRIGVAKPDGQFDTHARVEHQSQEVISGGNVDQRFARIL